jgi:sulfotransferase family protein
VLPTFLIIGSMKAGTTSLWYYLQDHPAVFCPSPKEINYFIGTGPHWAKGREWYESLFDEAGDAIAMGEASPAYAMAPTFDGVPARIAAVVPDVRLIYSVRHPIERMRAQWAHRVAMGRERRPAEEALRNDPNYLSVSKYAFQLERYLEHFSRDQILVITSEALRAERVEVMRSVYSFVGVDETWTSETIDEEHHRTADKPLRTPMRAWFASRGLLGLVRSVTPSRMRSWYTRRATRTPLDPSVSAELIARLSDELTPDLERLREIAGPQIDRWELVQR